MAYPKPGKFGVVDNPLIFTPFEENNSEGSIFPANSFLLMDGTNFLLMDGSQFLLMGS